MKPFVLSFIAGLLLASAGVATVTFASVAPKLAQVRKEWALKPIVVMSEDLPAGQAITFDVLSQRSVPARYVTDSMVTPDQVSWLINRPAPVPLEAGDPLLWGLFADASATDACFVAIAAKVHAAGEAAREQALSRFEERRGAPLPKPDPVPAPKEEASGEVPVVVAAADIPEGKVIDESMLTIARFPSARVTASVVPAEQLRAIVGTRALAPLQAKDALVWQLLDDAERPRRTLSCVAEVGAAVDEARKRATSEETAAHVRGMETP